MKAIIRKTLFFALVALVASTGALAQRVIKGTVYKDGEPAAGITVEAHKGGSMMTSFDGKYKVEADAKSKWIKFTFIDEVKKYDLNENSGDDIDFAFTGKIPSGDAAEETGGEVNLKSQEELIKAQNQDYITELSLYNEFYKQDDYKSAMPHWKKVYNQYPKSSTNIYIQGAKMMESMMENTQTDEEKDKQLDELIKLYDKRAKHFGQKGYISGRKGTTWLRVKLDPERTTPLEGDAFKETLKKGYNWLDESVKEQGNETELPVLVLLMQTSRSLFKLGEITKETVVNNYNKCNTIINAVIEKNDDEANVERAKTIQPIIESLFGTSGAADCESLISILSPQFEEKSDDIEFVTNMLRRLRRAKCDESDLYERATEKQYALAPTAEAAFNMAHRYINRDAAKAKEYYMQAINQETDQDLLATYYYEYGVFIFVKENALSEARGYAKKALAINPDYCEANMLIGNIYVAASRNFQGSDMQKSAVFWLAVDYFNKARRGEDCSVDAADKISTYKKYFPNKEEAFMENLKEGQTYKVEGWINESTTIRF